MKPFFTQARSHFTIFLLLLGGAAALEAETPTADDILHSARLSPMSQQAKLDAQLMTEDGKKIPFTISLDHGVINYDFTNPDQRIQLVLGEDKSDLRESVGSRTATVKPARYDEKVRGTSITYEDLALKLLYWPKPKLLGSEILGIRTTWKLEMQAPRGQSQYGAARLWIDKDSGAVLRIQGYDLDGLLVKQFEMISAQPIKGRWTLKTMRVESHDPKTQKITDLTYLKVLGESKQP